MSLLAMIAWLSELSNWTLFLWGGRLLGIIFVPFVLLERTARPLSAVAWILALLFLPYLGVLFWWLVGRNHFERARRRRRRARPRLTPSVKPAHRPLGGTDPPPCPAANQGLFPPTEANRVATLPTAQQAFDAFAEAIEDADDYVHLLFYVWKPDDVGRRFRDRLADAAARGVEVRALYDAVGSVRLTSRFLAPIAEAGGRTAPFLPVRLWEPRSRANFRNHRKLLIVDGTDGFTGGVNLAEDYLAWFDMAFGLTGDVVYQMQEIFAEDWYFATGEDLLAQRYLPRRRSEFPDAPAGPWQSLGGDQPEPIDGATARMVASGPDDQVDRVHKVFFQAINSARQTLSVITPYFVPDTAILTALETAALSGIDIRIIVPARSDVALTQQAGRFYWERLLLAGVRLYEYQGDVLHTKLMLADNDRVILGSANLDIRSFRLNFEANCVIESQPLNHQLSERFRQAIDASQQVELNRFRSRPFTAHLKEGTARLFSPLL